MQNLYAAIQRISRYTAELYSSSCTFTNLTNQKAPFKTALRYLNVQSCYYLERCIMFKWVIHDDSKSTFDSAGVTVTHNRWTSSHISTLYVKYI